MLKKGNKVYLVYKNIKIKKLSDKLDYKKLRLYKIKEIRDRVNYKLALPKNIKIYPVFYISFFELVPLYTLSIPYIEIDPINLDTEYKVREILDYRYIKKKIKYLIK